MNPREDLSEGGLRRDLSPVNFPIMTPRIQTVISCLIFLHNLSMIVIVKSKIENTNGNCIRATKALALNGDGSTPTSCMGCDPTYGDCYFNCQMLVDSVYKYCAGGCLPASYYYDPQSELTDCWVDVLPQMKIKVERCGCNLASSSFSTKTVLTVALVLFITLLFLLG